MDLERSGFQDVSGLPLEPQQQALPVYEYRHEDAPGYSADSFHTPILTYHLRATKTNTSHFVPFGPANNASNPSSYEIRYRSPIALSIFKRSSDISIFRIAASSSNTAQPGQVAHADFHSDGPMPYCPRARFAINGAAENGQETVVEMRSDDWTNWSFDLDSNPYVWTLRKIPTCIELASADLNLTNAPPVIARFTYGKVGTKVLPGGEVGKLEIWRDALTASAGGIEAVVTGCLVVVRYFEGLGRRYRNDGSGGSGAASLINAKGKKGTKVRAKFVLF